MIPPRQVTGKVSAARERDRLLDMLMQPGCDAVAVSWINEQVDDLEERYPEIRGAPLGGVDDWAARHGGGPRHAAGTVLAARPGSTRAPTRDPVAEARDALPWPPGLAVSCPRARGFVRRYSASRPAPPGVLEAFITDHPYDCARCWRHRRSWRRRFRSWLLASLVLAAIITTAPL